jgi:plastocyanin
MNASHALRLPALVVGLGLIFLVAACGDDGGGTGVDTGQIQVTVTTDGSAEEGVMVSLFAQGATSATATDATGGNGVATFADVEPGTWELEVDPPEELTLAEGEQSRKSVTATAGETAELDFALTGEGDVVEVTLTQNLTFSPDEITISPGTRVRWVNGASIFHTITPDGHSEWNRATVSQAGETFEHTFENAGVFPYFCEPHLSAGMTGTITVQ